MLSDSKNNHLMPHVLDKLLPDVFCHPLWIYSLPKSTLHSSEVIDRIKPSIQQLAEQGDYRNAAQLLLACAALQKRSGDPHAALATLQNVWAMGTSQKMPEITRWAAWGACSICAEQNEFAQAAKHIEQLQLRALDTEDWVLTATIGIVKNVLLDHQRDKANLTEIVSWLRGWGDPSILKAKRATQILQRPGRVSKNALPRFSLAWWTVLLQTIKKYITGEQDLLTNQNGQTGLQSAPLETEISSTFSVSQAIPEGLHQRPGEALPTHLHIPTADSRFDRSPDPMTGRPFSAGDRPDQSLSLKFYCLGPFQICQGDHWVSHWTSRKALAVIKCLVIYHPNPISKDILMDLLWPDADAESARRNLHQAIYSLRQTMKEGAPDYQHVLFENEHYFLNPEMDIWLDFIEFEENYRRGQQMEQLNRVNEAMQAYEAAELLYRGDFMAEDLYEDLPIARRHYYWGIYLTTAFRLSQCYMKLGQIRAAIAVNQKVLERDRTHEAAHQALMKCYVLLGQRNLAVRQYQICVEILREELDLPPSAETRAIYQQIIRM
jgi:DNA-binding SARP family transcriptional activator